MIPKPVRRKRYLAVGAGLAGIVVLSALPSAAGPDLEAVFKRHDKNGDGLITAQEFWGDGLSPKLVSDTRSSVRVDANTAQPNVSRDSFAVVTPPSAGGTDWGISMSIGLRVLQNHEAEDPRAHEFVGMDANQDDTVDFAEYRVRLQAMLSRGFDLLDADHDGFVNAAEFAFTDDDEILRARLFGGNKPDCPGCTPAPARPDGELAAGFATLDVDGDNQVSLSEYLSKT